MKKLTAIILTLALLIFPVALAESADFLGTWYLNEMTMGDNVLSPSALGMDMTLELNEDGTAVLASPTEEAARQEATWKLEGDVVTVTVDGEDMTLSLQDGALKGEQGGMGMNFGREKVETETYQPAEARADATEADYAGNWQAAYMDMDGTYLPASMLGMDLTAVIEGTGMTLNGMYGFENNAYEAAFSDGALVHQGGDDEMYTSITAQLLEDGALRMTFMSGDTPLVLFLEKAE